MTAAGESSAEPVGDEARGPHDVDESGTADDEDPWRPPAQARRGA